MDDLVHQLTQRFGFTAFRPGQEAVIRAVLAGRDALAVMPTGQGKSLCYQLPATLLPGLTVVVSPLIALMQDQVESVRQRQVAAAAFHSGLSERERDQVIQALRLQRLQLLYLAPERMQHEGFLRLLRSCLVSLLVVDEAHCLSQWGHDFRPDYLKIDRLRRELNHPPCLALTATATKRVQDDCCGRLGLRNPLRLVTGFRRSNLAFSVRRCLSRFDKLTELNRLIAGHPAGTVLVYCATRRAVEEVAGVLRQTHAGVGFYHAGLADDERRAVQEAFRRGVVRILVATNAFGMGIDKPDVRLVVHFDVPGSLEAYYQEAGRAGRDGKPASCVLLFHERDVGTQEYFIRQAANEAGTQERADRMRTLLRDMVAYVSTRSCRQLAILEYFSDDVERALGPCRLCDRCRAAARPGPQLGSDEDGAPAGAVLETIAWCRGRFGVTRIVDILRGSRSRALLSHGQERCPTYGRCRALSKTSVTRIIRALIDAGYVRIEGADYPVLALTTKGDEAARRVSPVVCSGAEGSVEPAAVARLVAGNVPLADSGLFEKLRHLRRELAEEEGVAPFVIFHDKTLRTIARRKPATSAALSAIPGIGAIKAERYGRRVLAVVNDFLGPPPRRERGWAPFNKPLADS